MEWSEGGEWDNCNSIINKYIKKKEKVMVENFPNLMREKVTQIQESQRVPIKLSLIHISEPTRRVDGSRMPSSA